MHEQFVGRWGKQECADTERFIKRQVTDNSDKRTKKTQWRVITRLRRWDSKISALT